MANPWDDALGRMQPSMGGANRAGKPGMGAGPVPYAPGMTQYAPNNAPQRNAHAAAPDLPVNAGGRPGGMPAPSQAGGQQVSQAAQSQIDPMTSVYYMQKLYDWFMNGRNRIQR